MDKKRLKNSTRIHFLPGEKLSFGNIGDYVMIILGVLAAAIYAIGHMFFVLLFGQVVSLFVSRMTNLQCNNQNLTLCISNTTGFNSTISNTSLCSAGNQTNTNTANSQDSTDSFHNDVHAKVILLVVVGLIQLVVCYFQYIFFELASTRLTNRIRIDLFKATLSRNVSYFDTTKISINNLFDNLAIVQSGIGWTSSAVLSGAIFVVAGLILAFITDWTLTLIVIASEPLSVGAAFMLSKLTAQTTISEMKSYGHAGQVAEEVLTTFRTVTAFNAQNSEQIRYASKLKNNTKYALRKGFMYGCYVGILSIFTYWTTALGFLAGIWLQTTGLHPTLDISQIVVVVTLVTEGIQFLGYLAPSMKTFLDACAVAWPILQYIEEAEVSIYTVVADDLTIF
ncbi:unnamed protein product [Adineta steineri]|uniref:ABC transmembrane type-1 domain-containing protein n=1 Tax=Adineta steineri TaxID=433720 RepID=A0A814S9L5_9BILA|nr:unnamed protein product [Adineta steineri]CAF1144494.1 unnamed protein product [Adineta steineri]